MPTLIWETQSAVKIDVPASVPDDEDVEAVAKAWAARAVERGKDYALAFRADGKHLKLITRVAEIVSERLVEV